jgi:hypothetical protein
LGISLPTLYSWITRYHGLSFRQFKRKFLCSGNTCIVVDHGAADYSWKYTIADRLHAQKGCVCFIEGSDHLLMTTMSATDTAEALRAELAYENQTGLHHLRYPVRLPIFRPEVWEIVNGKILHPVIPKPGELKRLVTRLPGGKVLHPVHPGAGETT